jgi:putative SOS response-associated peptidase YedK
MCARVTLASDAAALKEAFPGIETTRDLDKRYNIAPSQDVAAITNADGMRIVMLRWGLIPHWAKDARIGNSLINARAETLSEKPSFRDAYQKRRCLVVVDGFYEWRKAPDGSKAPVYICLRSGLPFGLAGLWEIWDGSDGTVRSCTIITTEANELVEPAHDRMPVIIHRGDIARWLAPEPGRHDELRDMLVPYPAADMEAYEVSRFVNDPHNDSIRCIQPLV